MDEHDERRQAAEVLAAVRGHQERTRRAARLPWWVYAAMFVLVAGVTAANDAVDLTGAKVIAALVLVALLATLVITFAGRTAPMARIRGIQRRQTFEPRVFAAVVVLAGVVGWLVTQYGSGVVRSLADAVGLGGYPNTVAGILLAVLVTALFALTQWMTSASQRSAAP